MNEKQKLTKIVLGILQGSSNAVERHEIETILFKEHGYHSIRGRINAVLKDLAADKLIKRMPIRKKTNDGMSNIQNSFKYKINR